MTRNKVLPKTFKGKSGAAVAAMVGMKKWGKKKMASMAAAGRKKY